LSTSDKRSVQGRGEGSHVASYDDIHKAVEKMGKRSKNHDDSTRKLPGQFISNELEEQTARFIEDVKGLAQRRKARESDKRSGPPPRGGGGGQRSSLR
jgi:hypothetical protein